jgi:hypothetical protein
MSSDESGEDVLGALDVLAHHPHRGSRIAAAQGLDKPPVLLV